MCSSIFFRPLQATDKDHCLLYELCWINISSIHRGKSEHPCCGFWWKYRTAECCMWFWTWSSAEFSSLDWHHSQCSLDLWLYPSQKLKWKLWSLGGLNLFQSFLFFQRIFVPLWEKRKEKWSMTLITGFFFFNIWQRKCLFSSKGGMTLALNKCLRIRMFCFFLHIFSGWMSNSWAETLFLSWNCRNKLDASDETYSGCHYICLNVLAVIQPELISSTMGKHSFLLSFQWVKKAYG